MSHTTSGPSDLKHRAWLALAALGVVFGDIGTSPLYAVREAFHGPYSLPLNPQNVLGVLSLIFWALVLVISLKYLAFILRADNRGEGGILALMALAVPTRRRPPSGWRYALVLLGLFGASLLYGDGIITPAISVLSAVEGLSVAAPVVEPYVVPITISVLVGLFLLQRRGTAKIGSLFGPVMIVWFTTLAALGIFSIIRYPQVLGAIHPGHAVTLFASNGWAGFMILSIVFLAVTGGEALYADMGHFGRPPIRYAWFGLVLPALLLNYFGQGALLLRDPSALENPFFHLAPEWMRFGLVALATSAAVIASQALISGVFSLTRQAIHLGYCPRLEIRHTSEEEIGQVYIPAINWALMFGCIGLVLAFGSSSRLAAAYGICVALDMVITTILASLVVRNVWKWGLISTLAFTLFFLAIDLAFLGANIPKIPQGAWFPLLMAAGVLTLMTTWKRGREILAARLRKQAFPLEMFLQDLQEHPPLRVPGVAVFLTRDSEGVPLPLLHNLKHNKVLHETAVLVSIISEETPQVPGEERLEWTDLGGGLYRVVAHYGFKETPSIPAVLHRARLQGLDLDPTQVTYFLGRETILATTLPGMALWRERLFGLMARNARSAASFFRLPSHQVVELGMQVEL